MGRKSFREDAEEAFGGFLRAHDFVEEDCLQYEHPNGRVCALFYTSERCKICIFDWAFRGPWEFNCFLAPRQTKNATDDLGHWCPARLELDGWHPYRLLLLNAGVKLQHMVPLSPYTRRDAFREFSNELSAYFDVALQALASKNVACPIKRTWP